MHLNSIKYVLIIQNWTWNEPDDLCNTKRCIVHNGLQEKKSSKKWTGSKVYCIMYYTVHCKLYSIPHSAQYTVYWIGQRFCPLTQNAIRSTRRATCPILVVLLDMFTCFGGEWANEEYTVLYTTRYTVNFTVYHIVHSTVYWELQRFTPLPQSSSEVIT